MKYRISGVELNITGGADALRAMGGFAPFEVPAGDCGPVASCGSGGMASGADGVASGGIGPAGGASPCHFGRPLNIKLIEGVPSPSLLRKFYSVDATQLREVFFATDSPRTAGPHTPKVAEANSGNCAAASTTICAAGDSTSAAAPTICAAGDSTATASTTMCAAGDSTATGSTPDAGICAAGSTTICAAGDSIAPASTTICAAGDSTSAAVPTMCAAGSSTDTGSSTICGAAVTELDLFGLEDGLLKCHATLDEAAGEATITFAPGCLSALRLALWEVFGWHALPFGIAAIHSASICCDGRGIMFLGGSGTGKSTHARMWLQAFPAARLLNDDSPIVACAPQITPPASASPASTACDQHTTQAASDQGSHAAADITPPASASPASPACDQHSIPAASVSGSPWGGKTPLFLSEEYPLAAMVRLSQAPADTIRRLTPLEALTSLLPSFAPCLKAHPRLSRDLMAVASRLVRQVPLYRLRCQPHPAAAELCRATIFGA